MDLQTASRAGAGGSPARLSPSAVESEAMCWRLRMDCWGGSPVPTSDLISEPVRTGSAWAPNPIKLIPLWEEERGAETGAQRRKPRDIRDRGWSDQPQVKDHRGPRATGSWTRRGAPGSHPSCARLGFWVSRPPPPPQGPPRTSLHTPQF